MFKKSMFSELVEQIEGQLGELVDVWAERFTPFVDPSRCTISSSKAKSAFLYLLFILNSSLERSGSKITFDESLDKMAGAITHNLTDGESEIAAVQCIKTMRKTLTDSIEHCIATDHIKLQAAKYLHSITDAIEIRILEGKGRFSQNQLKQINETEAAFTNEKTKYKSIFEVTSNLVLITDEAGNIVEVNPTAQIFFANQQIKRRFCGDLLQIGCDLETILDRYPPDTTHEIQLPQDGVIKTLTLQTRRLSKNYPFVKGLLLILSDITCVVDHRQVLEQRVVERTRALGQSEKLLDAIFQSMGQGLLLLDYELEIVRANQMASEMYGVPLEVLMGSNYTQVTDMHGLQLIEEICGNLADGEISNIETAGIYVDGRPFPALVTVTSMHLDDQRFSPLIVRDISRDKELEEDIIQQKRQAEEMNVTLRTVLGSIEKEKKEFEENLSLRIRSSLLPGIARIRHEGDKESRDGYLTVLQEQMISLTSNFSDTLDGDLLKLSKTELRICRFIKAGLTGKEICDTINLSFETIQTHRKNIRKKLGLRGREVNLHAFLADRAL